MVVAGHIPIHSTTTALDVFLPGFGAVKATVSNQLLFITLDLFVHYVFMILFFITDRVVVFPKGSCVVGKL